MEHPHAELGRKLITCGTILVVAALILVGFQNWLAADDVRDHRNLAAGMLRESAINSVTLAEWEPPSTLLPWTSVLGGLGVIVVGIRIASKNPGSIKPGRLDQFD